ncbi:phosphotriesterase family protein [Halapricum hydrolyticum]|uniref:Esterase n=1 Tax=Halapricum hydrolyticum TaxID=2979991 RepID=A0AAE3LDQ2_9EURY|nr:esterase [Halapricum hydrolyticum]MCU4716964.1 esterase [Halapricum hydrolyticum]MCU4725431.1 esterase [Halapricum hydrolyticum]
MAELITTQGTLRSDDLGLILPHEHVFVDLGPIEEENWRDAKAADVIELMGPEVEAAMSAGVTCLVECTPTGVGRRADIDVAVSEATGLPLVLPTGIYREPHIPDWARDASETEIREWMVEELTEGIENTGVRAAWIKLASSDDGVTEIEEKILRAAAAAGAETGALIGSHTTAGRIAHDQLDVIEDVGYDPSRFVWIHTQAEDDPSLHREVAERGAWIEYDAIGGEKSDAYYLDRIESALDAGLGDHVLLSMDRGWYDPSAPGGGEPDPYTYLPETFLPKLSDVVGEDETRRLTHVNPFQAFARRRTR